MSERYGACRLCEGHGCGTCGDTGFGGGILDLEQPFKKEWTKPRITCKQDVPLISAINAIKEFINE